MNAGDRAQAQRVRTALERGAVDGASLRAGLAEVAALERDAWLDVALGLEPPPDDGPALPPGGVPYLPCPVAPLLRALDAASVIASDVFVDIGSGVGRAAAVASLITGATVVGVEVQPSLLAAARALARRLHLRRVTFVEGDAADLPDAARGGSVFFLYCPFSGDRLQRLVTLLRPLAVARELRVCCVDLPLPPCPWLAPVLPAGGEVQVYRAVPARS